MKSLLNLLALLGLLAGPTLALDFFQWVHNVQNPSFQCPQEETEPPDGAVPLVQVVNCDQENATFRYDFKLKGGKKPKKGPFEGKGTLIFPTGNYWQQEASSYGFKYQKCLRLSTPQVAKISGTFRKDELEGDITVTYWDESVLKGWVKGGKLVGIYRQFGGDGTSLNMTEAATGETFWRTLPSGFSVLACQKESLGKRCLITRDIFYEMKSCLQVDSEFFVDCFTLQDHNVPKVILHEYLKKLMQKMRIQGQIIHCAKVAELVVADSCKLRGLEQLPSLAGKKSKKLTKILLTQHKEVESEEKNPRFHCLPAAGKISYTLIQWIWTMSDPLLLWYQFHHQPYQPLDSDNPQIDITIDYPLTMKEKVQKVSIETLSGTVLFEGFLENGRVQGKVDPQRVNHPGWRGRLVLGLHDTTVQAANPERLSDPAQRYSRFLLFELEKGRMKGLVQGFGLHFQTLVSGFSEDHPPEISLIAWYENGSLVPPFWRRNVESPHSESWTYVESEINDQVYILSANFTQVKKKIFNEAQEPYWKTVEILDEKCNENGMKVLVEKSVMETLM